MGCGTPNYNGPKSDHFDGERFFNPAGSGDKSFWTLLKWQLTEKKKKWPKFVEQTATPQIADKVEEQKVVMTFVNHATMLIQLPGINILIDPIWSERTSPFSWVGPKRVRKPGVEFAKLPKIDLVLVSHNHYDHLDVPTLKQLSDRDRPKIVIPLGDDKLLQKERIANFHVMDWWQSFQLGDSTITFVPAQHWSARGIFDRRKSLWGGFVISRRNKNIYYSGDAGYSSFFTDIGKKFGSIDVALLPVGSYEPRWFMKFAHMNPADAVQAHIDLKANKSIGVHFGTFQLTNEGIDDPVLDLKKALAENPNIPPDAFIVMDVGESRIFSL